MKFSLKKSLQFWTFLLCIGILGCQSTTHQGEQGHAIIHAKINKQPVRFAFDTGAQAPALFRPIADRLNLVVTDPPPGFKAPAGRIAVGYTEPVELEVFDQTQHIELAVLDLPKALHTDFDGFLGGHINLIYGWDATNPAKIRLHKTLPPKVKTWQSFPIRHDSETKVLAFDVMQNGVRKTIAIDTGNPNGVSLAPELWRSWKASHPNAPVTLTAYYMPGSGLMVQEEMWASELRIGSLLLTNVPIREANISEQSGTGPQFIASFGLAALRRLDGIIDGHHNLIFLNPRRTRIAPYQHNRLGAVFVSNHVYYPDTLKAHVVPNSPAYEAGIRNGDILLWINGVNYTRWRDKSVGPPIDVCQRPPGSKLHLTLKRGEKTYETIATLRHIIGPAKK